MYYNKVVSSSKFLHLNQMYLPWLCISPSADLPETFPNLPYDRMSSSPELKEDPMECPLCMEPLEIDDVNFFPCTCGYQICRFCWHRIRTDENGLCPACRKVRFLLEMYIQLLIVMDYLFYICLSKRQRRYWDTLHRIWEAVLDVHLLGW